jgi:4'-phosphopantetheinyl transferase
VSDWFTPAEQELVQGVVDGEQRDLLCNLVWSAKESALKVLRTGLRRDTRSVEVAPGTADAGAWAPLSIRAVEGAELPGWWRRDGRFLLTVASDRALPVPVQLPGSAALDIAEPVHSWVDHPLAD